MSALSRILIPEGKYNVEPTPIDMKFFFANSPPADGIY